MDLGKHSGGAGGQLLSSVALDSPLNAYWVSNRGSR